jgi:Uma2 family endonuclease
MSLAQHPQLTPQEFLSFERDSSAKHEYFRGSMVAMAGASVTHNRLVRNLLAALDAKLKGGPCEVFPSDLRLHCPGGLLTYPDVQVICGAIECFGDERDTVVNPKVIIEVLSKSTERYDRGDKFAFYREIPTLAEYVLVSYWQPLVERFVRQQDGWLLTETRGLTTAVELAAIGVSVPLDEIYRDVELPASVPRVIGDDESDQ